MRARASARSASSGRRARSLAARTTCCSDDPQHLFPHRDGLRHPPQQRRRCRQDGLSRSYELGRGLIGLRPLLLKSTAFSVQHRPARMRPAAGAGGIGGPTGRPRDDTRKALVWLERVRSRWRDRKADCMHRVAVTGMGPVSLLLDLLAVSIAAARRSSPRTANASGRDARGIKG